MKNQINLTERNENIEKVSFYPIIQNNKFKRNKFLNNIGNNTMKSLKNKTDFNYFKNKIENKTNGLNTKSLKLISPENKYSKIQKFMDLKTKNFFNKNKLKNNIRFKNEKKSANNRTFNNNSEKKNTEEMKDILNRLIKLKQKINEINIIKKKKLNFAKIERIKQDNLAPFDKPDKTKYKLKFRNKKIINLENTYKDENEIKKYKTEINFNSSNKKSLITKNSESSNKKRKLKLKLSVDKNNSEKNNETNFTKKEISTSLDRKRNSYNYNNIITNHANYIDKIRDSELINLINKFKKSMKKNQKEEINHRKSLVFPSELVNYIIKMKKELIIDKYRNEYLNKIDTYKYNTQKILRAIKTHRNNNFNINKEFKNTHISENNISRSNIKKKLSQKISDITETTKNNVSNNFFDDKLNLLFN